MSLMNRPLFKGIVLLLLAGLLVSCGGKEERKAKYLERGKAYMAEKNYDKARVEFKNVMQIDPKDARGRLYLGELEEKGENWAKAFAAYKKAVELDPDLIEARVRVARFYLAQANAMKARDEKSGEANALGLVQEQIKEIRLRQPGNLEAMALEAALWVNEGDTDKAQAQLEKVVARDPGLQSAAILLAKIYDQKGHGDDAETVLVKAIAENTEHLTLQQNLAVYYAQHKKNDQAETVLRKIVEEHPEELNYRVSLASFLGRTGQLDKAEQALNDAIAADPEDLQRYLLVAEFLASRKGNQAAIAQLEQFIVQKPDLPELRTSLARLYLRSDEKDKAKQTLEKIIEVQGSEPAGLTARVILAQVLASDNMDDARVTGLLKEVLDENPRDNGALLLSGKIAANHKNYVDAINDFRSVLKDQPDNAEVLQLLAAAHLANNERTLAEDTLRRGVEADPGNIMLRRSLAQLLVEDGDVDAAIQQIDEGLKINKRDQEALRTKFELLARKGDAAGMEEVAKLLQEEAPESEVGFIQEARLRLAEKDYDAAMTILDNVLSKHPESVPALVVKSEILTSQKKYPEAITVIDELQKVAPDSGEGYFRKGRILALQNDAAGAIGQYELALQKAPKSDEVLAVLVDLEFKSGKADAAEQRLLAILDNSPEHRSANGLLGVVYTARKEFPKAVAAFEQQIAITPENARAYTQLAQVRVMNGDLDGAVRAYKDGLAKLPDDTQLMLGMAGVRERQQDYEAAISLYENILERQPGNAISTNNLAALLADHRSDEASLDRAVALSADLEKTSQPAFLDTAAWVYYRKGDYDKAARILEEVVGKAPGVPVFQYHLGMVYLKQGDKAAARKYLTKATDGDYAYQGIEEARATLKSM